MNEAGLALVVGIFVVGAIIIVMLLRQQRGAEQAASHHDERPDTTEDRFYGGADRPAGPDAEDPPTP
ncbi:MAG: hypothetical protein ACXIVQ_11180 [Acidimicrobiales bacterium]